MSIGKDVVGHKINHRKREYETEKAIVKGTQRGLSDFQPKFEVGDIVRFKLGKMSIDGTVISIQNNGLTMEELLPLHYVHMPHSPRKSRISGKFGDFILIKKSK